MKRLLFISFLFLLLTGCRSTSNVYNYGTDISAETVEEIKTRTPNQYVYEDYDAPTPNWNSPRGDTTN